MTTSKRPALFKATIESFTTKAREWPMVIKQMVIYDDGSSEEQRAEMQALPQTMMWTRTEDNGPEVMGHAVSMQKLWVDVTNTDDDVFLHIEDDWVLTRPGCPIMAALDVLLNNPKLIQCCFGAVDRQHQQRFFTPTGTAYTIRPWAISRDMYPPFTLNPSVIRVSALKDVGNFENVEGFELQYGLRCNLKGWRTADLYPSFLRHLGDGQSAYDLNGTKR